MEAGPSPVIRVQARSADVIVQTWDRPEVHITSSANVDVRRFGPQAVARAIPGGDVPIFATQVQTAAGPVALKQEDFPVDGIAGSPHEAVQIFGGDGGASIVITVPANTALVVASLARGNLHVANYHSAMVLLIHNGGIEVSNSSGEAYVEAARGGISIVNSNFDRIRARTAVGNIFFTGCNVRQVEVDSVRGNIAYDNGTFAPGMARFEAQEGNIALGVAGGGVRVSAHSANGRVISALDRNAGTVSGSSSDAEATINGGGPVVTAHAGKGSIFLYSGTLRGKPRIQRQIPPPPHVPFRAKICAKPRCRV